MIKIRISNHLRKSRWDIRDYSSRRRNSMIRLAVKARQLENSAEEEELMKD
jgi:hypothetical protein